MTPEAKDEAMLEKCFIYYSLFLLQHGFNLKRGGRKVRLSFLPRLQKISFPVKRLS